MLKFVCTAVLVAVQLGSFYGVSAINALAPGSSFTAAMIDLRNAANVFATDRYNGPFPPNVTALEGIAEHIKSCSDAFDAATIQLAAVLTTPLGASLSQSDAATLNTVYLPSIQQDILGNLDSLQAGQAFFEGVNNNHLLSTMYCHWVGILSLQNTGFLSSLAFAAPSANYTSDWEQLASNAASQYSIWLVEDGFNCGGVPCWLNGGNP
ncbi:hypothetical protein C8R44DRAFT_771922 [Mycena epipterygia]|nr:hypothetical protein C8R44DRAFT_771922 [Mycena epipterygia]